MLPKKLFLFFLTILAFVWTPSAKAQNKAITQIIVQKQDSSWGTNVAQALLNHLYLQLRLGKISGYTDVTCQQKISTQDIPMIEKYYQRRLDSADGIFLYEQWNFEKDSIQILQGGISIILQKTETIQKKKKQALENKKIELIYFPYSSIQTDLCNAIIPANMNGNCEIHYHDWIKKRGFSGEIIFFEGRFFDEEEGLKFEEKIKSKFHFSENNALDVSQKMEHFLYGNHAIYDPLGKEISDVFSQFFTEKPEEYFNIFPQSKQDFLNFDFPEIEQIIVRRKIFWKNNQLESEPKDLVFLYRYGIQPDTFSIQQIFKLNLSYNQLSMATFLATSSKERLFQINSSPIPREFSTSFYDLLENPNSKLMWGQLIQKQKEYETLLD